MRTLTVGNKDYKIEFTIEASLYADCTEKVTSLMAGVAEAQSNSDVKELISTMSNIPQTVLHMMHAGLLEHNSDWSLADTKSLIKEYLLERKGKEDGDYYSLMGLLLEEMSNDGFFELIGLSKMFQTEEVKREPKKPQDHKKKASTKHTES